MNAIIDASAKQSTILVVDDELRLLNSMSAILDLHGYTSLGANGGNAGIEAMTNGHFDLILLDLCMPDVNGHKVMEWITQQKLDTCVIVVSGDTSIDSAISALRHGAYDFLRKPYETDELLLKIDNALSRRRLEIENKAINLQLRESERWYRYMVNNSPDIIYTLDANGICIFFNDRVESLLGFSKDLLIGKHFSTFIDKDDQEDALHLIEERQPRERDTRVMEIRVPHATKSTILTLEFNSFGIYDETHSDTPHKLIGTYGVAKDITERKKATEIISYQAYHDMLTGLANQRLFKDHFELAIAQATRYKHKTAMMFIDLDRFKVINDTLGHATGDALLVEVTERLKGCLREGDTLARQGGDEFTLLLPQIEIRENAECVANKIIKSLDAPFSIDGHEVHVSMSIGVALYPDDGKSIDILIKNADIAMYDSKAKGRNRYQFYDSSMNTTFDKRFSLEIQMRKALERGEFQVVYQPQINIVSGEISGMETLLRWKSPILGQLSPLEFIPLAEETGLIIPISEFVLKSAFNQAKLWKQAGLLPRRVAVNISAQHLEQKNFVAYIAGMLEEYEIEGSMFEIEITEGMLLNDSEHIIEKLKVIASMGVKIALDDFGTGYSSLSYLMKFPIHTIKIDQSFMLGFPGNSDNNSIVTAICSMAQGMNLNIIAEGVEGEDQYRTLHTLRCNEAQGFLFSKPLSSHDITELLFKNTPLVPHYLRP